MVSRTLSGEMAASYVLVLLVLSAAWTNGQVVFGDEDAPRKPPTSAGNTNSNNNIPAGQQTRSQFPFTGFAVNGLNGLAGVSQQLGSLVNQFINPFIPGGGPGQQRPPPGNFEPDRNGGCRTFQNGRGTCTRLNSCASLNNILNSRPPFQANRIIRRSICGFSGNGPLVCCPFDDGFGGNGGNFGGQGGNGGQFGQGGGNFGNGNFGGQGGNGGQFGGNGGQFGQGGNPGGNQGGNFGGTGGNQGGNFGGTGGNQGGNFGGAGGNPGGNQGGNQGGNFGGTGSGSNNNNGGVVTGGGNNNGGGFNGGNKSPGSIPESPKPVPTPSTTTSSPFNNNGGPVTLVPPKPKPNPTPGGGGGLVTGGSETNIYTVPGTKIECGYSNATHKRIIGGYDSEKDAWPWMSALGYKDSNTGGVSFLCGGALVSDQHVVTASHCVYNRDDLAVVRLGDLNLFSDADGATPVDVPVEKVIRHPDYNPNNFQNDIAVIKLSRKVPLSRAVAPICLPTSTEQRSNRYENTNPFVAGWGAIQFNGPSSVTLREVQLPVVENSVCEEKYKPFKSAAVDGNNICAGLQRGGKDACQGDSGGPLMMPQPGSRWILIGVVSYGFKCAEPGFPGVYSRVTSYVDWVTDTMKTA